MSHYDQFYSGGGTQQQQKQRQKGGGVEDIVLYRAPSTGFPQYQRGAGLGNFFSSAFRLLQPLLTSGLSVLADQGVKSTGAVLSQLGSKDLKSILKEEGQNAFKNLTTKAVNKLKQSSGQVGSGIDNTSMPLGLSPLQLQNLQRKTNKGGRKRRRHRHSSTAVAGGRRRKGGARARKIGTANNPITSRKLQLGSGRRRRRRGGRRRVRRKGARVRIGKKRRSLIGGGAGAKQAGGGRRRKRSRKQKIRELDIFN